MNCRKGTQCKLHEPTGRPYCEPSCDIDNGGCPDNQTCSLQSVTCIQAPCPPKVQCRDSELMYSYCYYDILVTNSDIYIISSVVICSDS